MKRPSRILFLVTSVFLLRSPSLKHSLSFSSHSFKSLYIITLTTISLLRPIEETFKTMADATEKAEHDRIFKKFDANGDGTISSTELGDALKNLGSVTHDDVKRMMAEIDTDGDGFISYQEFSDFAKANRGLMKDVAKIF